MKWAPAPTRSGMALAWSATATSLTQTPPQKPSTIGNRASLETSLAHHPTKRGQHAPHRTAPQGLHKSIIVCLCPDIDHPGSTNQVGNRSSSTPRGPTTSGRSSCRDTRVAGDVTLPSTSTQTGRKPAISKRAAWFAIRALQELPLPSTSPEPPHKPGRGGGWGVEEEVAAHPCPHT
jgi:hypothetical protein